MAVIHLCLAVPLVVHEEREMWPYLSTAAPLLAAESPRTDNAVAWDPVTDCDHWPSAQLRIASIANLPAFGFAQWGLRCPYPFSLNAAIGRRLGANTRKAEILKASAFLVLVVFQWVLIGSFPLVGLKPAWLEPAWAITICAALSCALLLIPGARILAPFTIACAVPAWFLWFCFLAFNSVRRGWKFLRAHST